MVALKQVILLAGDNRGKEGIGGIFLRFGHFELKLYGHKRELSYNIKRSAIFRCDVRLSYFERVRGVTVHASSFTPNGLTPAERSCYSSDATSFGANSFSSSTVELSSLASTLFCECYY